VVVERAGKEGFGTKKMRELELELGGGGRAGASGRRSKELRQTRKLLQIHL